MKLRFRMLTALLALSGLLALSAQEVAAATCAADMAAPAADAYTGSSTSAGTDDACRMMTEGGVPEGESEAPHCPDMPMNGGSCGSAVAVPAASALHLAGSPADGPVARSTDDFIASGFAEALFRPPIA